MAYFVKVDKKPQKDSPLLTFTFEGGGFTAIDLRKVEMLVCDPKNSLFRFTIAGKAQDLYVELSPDEFEEIFEQWKQVNKLEEAL